MCVHVTKIYIYHSSNHKCIKITFFYTLCAVLFIRCASIDDDNMHFYINSIIMYLLLYYLCLSIIPSISHCIAHLSLSHSNNGCVISYSVISLLLYTFAICLVYIQIHNLHHFAQVCYSFVT